MGTTAVRWFHSAMANAPVLNGQAGSLLAVLAACLEDGFDTKTINSISVASGVATVTISAGHTYDVAAVIRIAGATPAALNDDWRITAATASTLTFDCPGVPDGNATGTITCKRSPAGWTKAFSATNKAVYQAPSLAATRLFLRVDDTGTTNARVRGYEQMTSVDAGTNPFPTIATFADTAYNWTKSSAADSTSRPWVVVCDDAMIYLLTKFTTSASYTKSLFWFGDIVSYIPADAFHCAIAAMGTASPSFPGHGVGSMAYNSTTNGLSSETERMARRADQTALQPPISRFIPSANSGAIGGLNAFPAYPAPGGALNLYYPLLVPDTGASWNPTTPVRGHMPGMAAPWHSQPLSDLTVFDGGGVFEGRKMLMCAADYSANIGRIAFDITGPWR